MPVPGQDDAHLPCQRRSRRIGQHHRVAARRQRVHGDGHGQRAARVRAEKLRVGGRGLAGRVQQVQIPQLNLPALDQRRGLLDRP